jgi:Uncharacterised nucleotidyltransferase
MLRAALAPSEAALLQVFAWFSDRSWGQLAPPQRKVQPTLRRALERRGARHPWHADVVEYELQTAARNAGLARTAVDVAAVLQSAGVRALFLKGTALLARGLLASECRPMDDIDVQVAPAEYVTAARALEGAGFQRRKTTPHSRYAHALDLGRPGDGNVDLHGWQSLLGSSAAAEHAVFARAEVVAYAGANLLVPCRTDQLLQACLAGFPAAGRRKYQWLLDAVALLGDGMSAREWHGFEDAALQRDVVLPTREALAYLREVLDQPVPMEVLQRLYSRRPSVRDRLCYSTLVRHPVTIHEVLLWHTCNYEVARSAYGEPFSPTALAGHLAERYVARRDLQALKDEPLSAADRLWRRLRRPRRG